MQKHLLGFWRMWWKQASESGVAGDDSREAIHDSMGLLESLSSVLQAPLRRGHLD